MQWLLQLAVVVHLYVSIRSIFLLSRSNLLELWLPPTCLLDATPYILLLSLRALFYLHGGTTAFV